MLRSMEQLILAILFIVPGFILYSVRVLLTRTDTRPSTLELTLLSIIYSVFLDLLIIPILFWIWGSLPQGEWTGDWWRYFLSLASIFLVPAAGGVMLARWDPEPLVRTLFRWWGRRYRPRSVLAMLLAAYRQEELWVRFGTRNGECYQGRILFESVGSGKGEIYVVDLHRVEGSEEWGKPVRGISGMLVNVDRVDILGFRVPAGKALEVEDIIQQLAAGAGTEKEELVVPDGIECLYRGRCGPGVCEDRTGFAGKPGRKG